MNQNKVLQHKVLKVKGICYYKEQRQSDLMKGLITIELPNGLSFRAPSEQFTFVGLEE